MCGRGDVFILWRGINWYTVLLYSTGMPTGGSSEQKLLLVSRSEEMLPKSQNNVNSGWILVDALFRSYL